MEDILNSSNLIACPYCDIVFTYSSYLLHFDSESQSHCKNVTNTHNNNANDNYADNNNDNDNDDDNEDDNADNNANNDSPRISSLNLYNPMIDRGFTNTITQSSLSEIVDIGLGVDNLSLYSTKNPIKEDSYCVICMSTHTKGSQFYLMKCMHSFCEDCSKRWFDFKSVCPLCKTNMKNI